MLRGEVCDAEPAAFKLIEEFETLLSGDSLAGDRSLNLFHAPGHRAVRRSIRLAREEVIKPVEWG